MARAADRYLLQRDGRWHYVRRVPSRLTDIDPRGTIRVSLKTDSREVARKRRDALVEADNAYWASLIPPTGEASQETAEQLQQQMAAQRYQAARKRAMARGLVYAPASELADFAGMVEILSRLRLVDAVDSGSPSQEERSEAEAVLGGRKTPEVTVSQAFDVYCEEIAVGEFINKSDYQKRIWMKTKRRGVQNFIDLVGDMPLHAIKRSHALEFYNWWKDRLLPKPGRKTLSPNTANRDLGNMRRLYSAYFKHVGEEDRKNPFRQLNFQETLAPDVPSFESDWVRTRILRPGIFDGIKSQAALIVYALIETGARPGEIANLQSEHIRLDDAVPHIRIRARQGREIKTQASIRDIPLVGVSLAAMRQAPIGFPHYRDKPDLLSATLMKAFRNRELFPSENHVIYSFRHAFEKRMLEGGLDYGLRCTLMGHSNSRPAYGDGGSMTYRRDQLLKIVHPVSEALERAIRTLNACEAPSRRSAA